MRQVSVRVHRAWVAGAVRVVAGALGRGFTEPVRVVSRPRSAAVRCARVAVVAAGTVLGVAVCAGSALASSPTTIFPPGTVVVACPSHTECVAGNEAGQEAKFNPLSPGTTTPITFADAGSIPAGKWLGISCPALNQCTAVDGSAVVTFNPASPGTPTPTAIELGAGGYVGAIACPSPSQCSAVGDPNESIGGVGVEVTFNPASPGTLTPVTITSDLFLRSIACTSASRCDAVGEPFGVSSGSAAEVSFNPTSPGMSTPTVLATGEAAAVACPSPGQCTALVSVLGATNTGMEVTFNPASPGTPKPARIGGGIDASASLACPSLSQCTAVGIHTTPPSVGQEITFNPTSPDSSTGWSAAKCASTYKAWIRAHKHATKSQKKVEAGSLDSSHGCPRSAT